MREKVVPNSGSTVNHHMRQQSAVLADLDVSINNYICTDGSFRSDLGGSMDDGRRMDTAWISGGLVEEFGCPQIRVLRIFGTQCRLIDRRKTLFDNDRRSLRASRRCSVPGVGNKGDLAWRGGVNRGDPANLSIGIGRF